MSDLLRKRCFKTPMHQNRKRPTGHTRKERMTVAQKISSDARNVPVTIKPAPWLADSPNENKS
ncbi:hypothetical protein NBRC116590_03110 [Pelagimonas sp. KU-00592-HH]|uniref:hypothetical protein n=1 Tax=Pelagimonas sp. KU-00592-HH TaxID=3127651 RepID=UPI003107ECCB